MEVSSGEKNYLLDFKRFDCINVNLQRIEDEFWVNNAWEPYKFDDDKEIYIKWKKEVYISYIVILPSISKDTKILECELLVNDKKYSSGSLRPDKENRIYINNIASKMVLKISKYIGNHPGISELAVYSTNQQEKLSCFIKEVESKK